MSVSYISQDGKEIDISKLQQGSDFIAKVVIKNTGNRGNYSQMALTQIFPSGWEILNARMLGGEGAFKSEALSADEAFETDTPGIRIRCVPSTWRIVANNLIPRVAPITPGSPSANLSCSGLNLVISVDGEEHPIQLQKPMVLKLGDVQRTILLREAP